MTVAEGLVAIGTEYMDDEEMYDKAEEAFNEALELRVAALGEDGDEVHPLIEEVRDILADLQKRQDKLRRRRERRAERKAAAARPKRK